jgi:hypothetical protein
MTSNTNQAKPSQRESRRDRGRDEALRQLVPKILNILGEEHGSPPSRGGQVKLSEQVELSARGLGNYRVMLSVYWSRNGKVQKVFSAHVTDEPSLSDPEFYRYVDGTVGLLSWRRGDWETVVLAHAAESKDPVEPPSGGPLRD